MTPSFNYRASNFAPPEGLYRRKLDFNSFLQTDMSIGNPWSLKKIRSGKRHHSIGISLQCIFEQSHPVDDRFVGY